MPHSLTLLHFPSNPEGKNSPLFLQIRGQNSAAGTKFNATETGIFVAWI